MMPKRPGFSGSRDEGQDKGVGVDMGGQSRGQYSTGQEPRDAQLFLPGFGCA